MSLIAETSMPGSNRPRLGLAIASLVLGILGLVLSLFVVGAILGIAGLALGWVHLVDKRGKSAMAWWGVTLSVLSIAAGLLLGVESSGSAMRRRRS